MTVLVPSVIQKKTEDVYTSVSGTPVRVTTYLMKVAKAAQNDTIEIDTQLGLTTDKVIRLSGITIPTGGDAAQESPTLDDSDDEIVLASATTGTSWIEVSFSN